jgi:mycothiol synthase
VTTPSLAARLGAPVDPIAARHPEIARWRPPTTADIDAVHAVFVAGDTVDHPTWITPRQDIAEYFALSHVDPTRDMIVAETEDGRIVAAGGAFLHPAREGGALTVLVEGTVHPEHRRRGIGTVLHAWLDARAVQAVAEAASQLPDGGVRAELKTSSDEHNADLIALAERVGYRIERWFSTMVRDLAAPVPAVSAPDGIQVVPFSHDRDEDARIARNDAFRDHWGSRPTDPERWAQYVGGDFFRPDLCRLAIDEGGRIAAFCLASVNEGDWAGHGASHAYIDLIGVVRDHRRRGLAPLVVAAALQAMADAGLAQAVLDVDTASPTGANTLYENLGFRATERHVSLVRHL